MNKKIITLSTLSGLILVLVALIVLGGSTYQTQGDPLYGLFLTGELSPVRTVGPWSPQVYSVGSMNYYVVPNSSVIFICNGPVSSLPNNAVITSASICIELTVSNGTLNYVMTSTPSTPNSVIYGSFSVPSVTNTTNVAISALGDYYAVWNSNGTYVLIYKVGGSMVGNVTMPSPTYTYVGTLYYTTNTTTTEYFLFLSPSNTLIYAYVSGNTTNSGSYGAFPLSYTGKLIASWMGNGVLYQAVVYGSGVYTLIYSVSNYTLSVSFTSIASAPSTVTPVGSFYRTPPGAITWMEGLTPYVWVTYGNGTYIAYYYASSQPTILATYSENNPYVSGPTAGPLYAIPSGNTTYYFDGYALLGPALVYPYLGINFTTKVYGTANLGMLAGYNFSQPPCTAWFNYMAINVTSAQIQNFIIGNPFRNGLTTASMNYFLLATNYFLSPIVSLKSWKISALSSNAYVYMVSDYNFTWHATFYGSPAIIDYMQSYGFLLQQGVPLNLVNNNAWSATYTISFGVGNYTNSLTNPAPVYVIDALEMVPVETITSWISSVSGSSYNQIMGELMSNGYAELFYNGQPIYLLYDNRTNTFSVVLSMDVVIDQSNVGQIANTLLQQMLQNPSLMTMLKTVTAQQAQSEYYTVGYEFLAQAIRSDIKYGLLSRSTGETLLQMLSSNVYTTDDAQRLFQALDAYVEYVLTKTPYQGGGTLYWALTPKLDDFFNDMGTIITVVGMKGDGYVDASTMMWISYLYSKVFGAYASAVESGVSYTATVADYNYLESAMRTMTSLFSDALPALYSGTTTGKAVVESAVETAGSMQEAENLAETGASGISDMIETASTKGISLLGKAFRIFVIISQSKPVKVLTYAGVFATAFVGTLDLMYATIMSYRYGIPLNTALGMWFSSYSVSNNYIIPVLILGNGPTLSTSSVVYFVPAVDPLLVAYEVPSIARPPIINNFDVFEDMFMLQSSNSSTQTIYLRPLPPGVTALSWTSGHLQINWNNVISGLTQTATWYITTGYNPLTASYTVVTRQYPPINTTGLNILGIELVTIYSTGVAPSIWGSIFGWSGYNDIVETASLSSLTAGVESEYITNGSQLANLLSGLKVYVGNGTYTFNVLSYGSDWAYGTLSVPPIPNTPPIPYFGQDIWLNGTWYFKGWYICLGRVGYYNGTPVIVYTAPQITSSFVADNTYVYNYTLDNFPTPLMYIFRLASWKAGSAEGFLYLANLTSLIRWLHQFQYWNVMRQVVINGSYYYVPVNSSVLNIIDPLSTGRLWSDKELTFIVGYTFPATIILGQIVFNGTSPTNPVTTMAGLPIFSTVWQNATISYNGTVYYINEASNNTNTLGYIPVGSISGLFPPTLIVKFVNIGNIVSQLMQNLPPLTPLIIKMWDWVSKAQYLALPQLAWNFGETTIYKPASNLTRCTVYAYVYNAVNNTPIPGASVVMSYGAYTFSGVTNSSGYATLNNVTLGLQYVVSANATGFSAYSSVWSPNYCGAVLGIGLTPTNVTTAVTTVGKYEFTVYAYYENGYPASGVSITISNSSGTVATGSTDVTGEAVFWLYPGNYTITATLNSYTETKSVSVPTETSVTFVFPFMAPINFTSEVAITIKSINDLNGSGVYPITVEFQDLSNGTTMQYTLSGPTTFMFRLGHTIYWSLVSYPSGYTPIQSSGEFTATQSGTLVIHFVPSSQLKPANWTVTVQVVDLNNNPIAGANITVQPLNIHGTTDSKGEFQFLVPNGTAITITVQYYSASWSGTYTVTSNMYVLVRLNVTQFYLPPGPPGKLVVTLIQVPYMSLLNVTGAKVELQNPATGAVYGINYTVNGVATMPIHLYNYYNVSASYDNYTQIGTKTIYPIFSVSYYNAYMMSPTCTVYNVASYVGNNTLYPPLYCNGTVYVPLTLYVTYKDGVPYQGAVLVSNGNNHTTDDTGMVTVYYPVNTVVNNTLLVNNTAYYGPYSFTISNGTLIMVLLPFYSPIYLPYVFFTGLKLVSPGIAWNGVTSYNFTLVPEFLTNTPQTITVNYTVYMDTQPIESFLVNYTLVNGVNQFYTEFTVPPFLGNHTFIVKGVIVTANTTFTNGLVAWSNPVTAVGFVEASFFIYPIFTHVKDFPYLLPEDLIAFRLGITLASPINISAPVVMFVNYTQPWGANATYYSYMFNATFVNGGFKFTTSNMSVPWGTAIFASANPIGGWVVNAFGNASTLGLAIYPEVKFISVKAPPVLTLIGNGTAQVSVSLVTNIYGTGAVFSIIVNNNTYFYSFMPNQHTTQYTITLNIPVSMINWYDLSESAPMSVYNLQSTYDAEPWGYITFSINIYSLLWVIVGVVIIGILLIMILLSRSSKKKRMSKTYMPYWV